METRGQCLGGGCFPPPVEEPGIAYDNEQQRGLEQDEVADEVGRDV